MSIRPGKREASTPNCSATTSGRWLGSITPPVPTRMVEVAAATAAASTVGADPATPGTPWCSETQKRWKPSASASRARSTVSRSARDAS
ncbi:hypothetical protein GA0115253_1069011 [Streptomyces sp. Termitarium-T10T-6]|nr:hypothetical protein GA0115253_1069011 [Streptomyces sp. Termitarium-T10T-6]